jgi:hypothetical protein
VFAESRAMAETSHHCKTAQRQRRRSSAYRGLSYHPSSGRVEAHIYDKGKQARARPGCAHAVPPIVMPLVGSCFSLLHQIYLAVDIPWLVSARGGGRHSLRSRSGARACQRCAVLGARRPTAPTELRFCLYAGASSGAASSHQPAAELVRSRTGSKKRGEKSGMGRWMDFGWHGHANTLE